MNTNEIATAAVAKMDTAQLVLMIGLIEAQAVKTDEDKIMKAAIAEVLEERHNLTDAIEAICEDEDYEGTSYDALMTALTQAGVAA